MKQSSVKEIDKEDFVIDAMAMKKHLQEIFYEETKELSADEVIAYMQQQIANSEFAEILSQTEPEATPANKKA